MKNAILTMCALLVACTQATPSKPIEATPPEDNLVICAQDAKQCSDGKWVGRSGKNCEFVCN